MVELLPLRLEGATARRRGRRLVGPVDLIIEGSGATIIMGPNGAGKTTLLRLMHGLQRVADGHITFACPRETARHHQSFVFQRPVMLRRTVLENIAFPLRLRGMSRAEARRNAQDWAAQVGLSDLADRSAADLSAGEKQKLALARSLTTEPKLLFLDEPCVNLDGRATQDIEAILTNCIATGTRIVMATHDIGQARRLATEVVFLHDGRVHEQGDAKHFFRAPQTEAAQAYLRGDIVL